MSNHKKFSISKDELEKTLELMNRFNTPTVELSRTESNGIGTILLGYFPVSIHDTDGVYIVEISGIEEW